MRVGVVLPQPWPAVGPGSDTRGPWTRSLEIATLVESEELESVWISDHLRSSRPDELPVVLEAFAAAAAISALTSRVRVGTLVSCVGFRNPVLVAKMAATIDLVGNGRFELGVGAGWFEQEWTSAGIAFPSVGARLQLLEDAVAIISQLLAEGSATYTGVRLTVDDAVSLPLPVQRPTLPLIIGGNGARARALAIRFAGELNLDGLSAGDASRAIADVRQSCVRAGRDPDSLRISVQVRPLAVTDPRDIAAEFLRYREAGVARCMIQVPDSRNSDEPIARLAEAARLAA
jgi:alkanesulfonate monooxygenase SsuD/methylene tetrahydromethanopterin reductase-like flavin-dependent oxidoreductase (luciferase family)